MCKDFEKDGAVGAIRPDETRTADQLSPGEQVIACDGRVVTEKKD